MTWRAAGEFHRPSQPLKMSPNCPAAINFCLIPFKTTAALPGLPQQLLCCLEEPNPRGLIARSSRSVRATQRDSCAKLHSVSPECSSTIPAMNNGDIGSGSRAAPVRASKAGPTKSDIDPYVMELLEKIDAGKTILQFRKDAKIFSQGDSAEGIYFIQTGKVKITVVSAAGKEAVLAVLGPRGFLGEGCLVGQSLRISTATAIQSSTLVRIERRAMLRSLHAQPELSEKFTASLLARNIDLEEDLCDQLFNHSEKRLARVLLKLARFGQHDALLAAKMPRMSHETLAEMVGTTRSRVSHFMNKFRKLGLIDYHNGDITVRAELLTDVVLHD